MVARIKVLEVELSRPIKDLDGLHGYASLHALVRWNSTPVGYIDVPLSNGICTASALRAAVNRAHSHNLLQTMIRRRIDEPVNENPSLEKNDSKAALNLAAIVKNPLVTVAVCTRDRVEQLKDCLNSLTKLAYSNIEILVVDNAPETDETKKLVQASFPGFRYVLEPRPGLDWARNRAIEEANGEIITYTDDDVIVDPLWIDALVKVFQDDPGVMAVTGLVAPYEMDTHAQILFERYGGFGRGFKRRWYQVDKVNRKGKSFHYGAGQFGTGANMAYRKIVFEKVGVFDPALDVGTVTNGGGDLEMFFRVLEEGYMLVYEPSALVWHRHRKSIEELRVQLTNHGIGFYSFLVRSAEAYPQHRWSISRFGLWWFWHWNVRRLLKSFIITQRVPRDMIFAESGGALTGLTRYAKARSRADEISHTYVSEKQSRIKNNRHPDTSLQIHDHPNTPQTRKPTAIRTVDISCPLHAIDDLSEYSSCRIFVFQGERLLGKVDIKSTWQSISPARLCDAITEKIGWKLTTLFLGNDCTHPELPLIEGGAPALTIPRLSRLSSSISVSVVLATFDRPEQLRQCLQSLQHQETQRKIEIVVVDNHPSSGMTSPVVAEFPEVVLVTEARKGLSYARNAGFIHSSGEIVVATDDDVIMPPQWIEKLVVPFERNDVAAVTGNVLPRELETESQYFFEAYGGLGRGFEDREAGPAWFRKSRRRAAPTWQLGATANAAFRAEIFRNPEIGLLDEALGAGMPTGCSEDTYLFYRIIKAGSTIVYNPNSYVWHTHRRDRNALRSQIYNYSKGHVAYHLTTLLRDGDRRALFRLFVELPQTYIKRAYQRLRGRSNYPISLILLEIWGNMVGPFALWRSRRRVRREGRSEFPTSADHPVSDVE
ncbi:MAG: glycosyltransferase family 2 protein [Arenicellales bacterium]